MKWRALVGADTILEEFPKSPYFQFLSSHYPTNHTDPKCPKVLRCRDGTHFCIESMGSLNSEASALVPQQEIMKYHIYGMELANKVRTDIFHELGCKELQQSFVVEDLSGLGMSHLSMIETLKAFTQIDNNNYPETLRKVVIINVPTVFSIIWKAVEYFWDAKQVAKFQFISSGSDYSSILQKIVPLDHLPKVYSGELVYDLPKAIPLPELKLELSKIEKKQYSVDRVPRSGILEKEIRIETANIVLHYEFKTVDYDIGFGIVYKETGKNIQHILEVQRYNSHIIPVFGRITVQKVGSIVLQWDNTFSWMTEKELHYTYNVIPSSK